VPRITHPEYLHLSSSDPLLPLDNGKSSAYCVGDMTSNELRSALGELGMDQRQLAGYLRVTEGAVSRWVNGEREIPGPICKLVEMALAELEATR